MKNTAQKWQQKYAEAELSTPAEACWLLKQHARRLPLTGQALDLASGLAGNARFLARCGLTTQAWDISQTATDLVNKWAKTQGLTNLTAYCKDIKATVLKPASFDVIVVSQYLDRDIFSALAQALKPNGLLFYQTFLAPVQDQAPSNPAFYLQSGEMPQVWSSMLRCEVMGEGWLLNSSTKPNAIKQRQAWYIGQSIQT